jgi:integrase
MPPRRKSAIAHRGAGPPALERNQTPPPRSLATVVDRSATARGKRWRPPEGLEPAEINAIIDAATSDRDRLLLRTLWATGGRASEVLELRPIDVQRRGLVLPNKKNASRPFKVVALPAGHVDLVADLLLWAQQHRLNPRDPLFFSRVHRTTPGLHPRALRPISDVQLWRIVANASRRAGVFVPSVRARDRGELVPAWPHLFRHARVRQILKHSNGNLPLAMHTAGWSTLQVAYLRLTDSAAAELMEGVPE